MMVKIYRVLLYENKKLGNIFQEVVKLSEVNKLLEKLNQNLDNYFDESTEGSYKTQTKIFLHTIFKELKKQLGIE